MIVNGKPLKSMNQYYNKKKGKIQSQIKKNHNKNWSNSLATLALKRNNKIKDYLHKSSRLVVNYLKQNEISQLIIGYNKNWKCQVNLGKKTNQSFTMIPFATLLQMLEYKCKLAGIDCSIHEESYTSKCSALDFESIKHHEKYLGKRIKRGLFRTKNKILINSDVNGSLNIGRKEFGDGYFNSSTNIGLVLNPVKVTPAQN